MSEATEAKRDGARLTKNSGRGHTAGEKGDARWPENEPVITIDYKEYPKSFTLNQDFWGKICTDAVKNHDVAGVLKLVMGEDRKTRVFVVDEDLFLQAMECWYEKHYGEK